MRTDLKDKILKELSYKYNNTRSIDNAKTLVEAAERLYDKDDLLLDNGMLALFVLLSYLALLLLLVGVPVEYGSYALETKMTVFSLIVFVSVAASVFAYFKNKFHFYHKAKVVVEDENSRIKAQAENNEAIEFARRYGVKL